eukprot:6159120-Karenia_brevis.AAC.1
MDVLNDLPDEQITCRSGENLRSHVLFLVFFFWRPCMKYQTPAPSVISDATKLLNEQALAEGMSAPLEAKNENPQQQSLNLASSSYDIAVFEM